MNLAEIYTELRGLGLCVLPRRAGAKLPAIKWATYQPEDMTDARLIALQSQDFVSGWVVLTGVRSGGLVVIDIDIHNLEEPLEDVLTHFQGLSPSNFIISTPSGGYHIYYRLDPDIGTLRSGTDIGFKGVDIRAEGGLVVTLGSDITYEAGEKGFTEPYTGWYEKLEDGDYSHIPEMSRELYQWLYDSAVKEAVIRERPSADYVPTDGENKRVTRHFEMGHERRVQIVLECLSAVLRDWGTQDYDVWRAMWMSAYHGADGDERVLDAILSHPDIDWKDTTALDDFAHKWRNHTHREEQGNTVATLFYMARKAGWLASTGYEVSRTEKIHVQYVSEWLDGLEDYPETLLLISQTGSGKTRAFSRVWEKAKGKAVIFVPTTRLAIDLASKLKEEGVPAVCYASPNTLRPRDTQVLIAAEVLVTTAQTFIRRVLPHVELSSYHLAYFEEAGTLIDGFVRGGSGNFYGTHVNEREAQGFMYALQRIMQDVKYVWFVDATMTSSLSSLILNVRRIAETARNVRIIENTYVASKAPVIISPSLDDVLTRCAEAIVTGQRVVVACDTRNMVDEVASLMERVGVTKGRQVLKLNSTAAHTPEAALFLSNADEEAAKYDVIIYNSVIGSGVSVTSVRPDVVIQVARYLPPRQNLQILNRFRRQKQVICYYMSGENLNQPDKEELLEHSKQMVEREAAIAGVEAPNRSPLAHARAESAAISIADELRQQRSPAEFYRGLLERDGRTVIFDLDAESSNTVKRARKRLREEKKAHKEWLRGHWHEAPISITKEMIVPESFSEDEIEQGLVKGRLERIFQEGFEQALEKLGPERMFDLAEDFGGKRWLIRAFIAQDDAMDYSIKNISDAKIAVTAFVNQLTKLKVMSKLHTIMPDMGADYPEEDLEESANRFISEISLIKDTYDTLFTDYRHRFDYVIQTSDDRFEAAMKIIRNLLALAGLKLRKKKTGEINEDGTRKKAYHISNWDAVRDFTLYAVGSTIQDLRTEVLDKKKEKIQEELEVFETLTDAQKTEVLGYVASGMDIKNAIKRAQGKVIL